MAWKRYAVIFVSLLVLVVLCGGLARLEAAEVLHYRGIVSRVVGTPFGINATVGVTEITGSILYDLTTPPIPDNTANVDSFDFTIPNGLTLSINGAVLASSHNIIENINDVENFGGSDIFQSIAAGPLLVNNTSVSGFLQVMFADLDMLLFPTNASVSTLLPPSQIMGAADLVFGVFGQDGSNFIEFQMEIATEVAIDITQGRAERLGTTNGKVTIEGQLADVSLTDLDLGASTVTITSVLNEAGVELVAGASLPLTLEARPGSDADGAIFETPGGARPKVRVDMSRREEGW